MSRTLTYPHVFILWEAPVVVPYVPVDDMVLVVAILPWGLVARGAGRGRCPMPRVGEIGRDGDIGLLGETGLGGMCLGPDFETITLPLDAAEIST